MKQTTIQHCAIIRKLQLWLNLDIQEGNILLHLIIMQES